MAGFLGSFFKSRSRQTTERIPPTFPVVPAEPERTGNDAAVPDHAEEPAQAAAPAIVESSVIAETGRETLASLAAPVADESGAASAGSAAIEQPAARAVPTWPETSRRIRAATDAQDDATAIALLTEATKLHPNIHWPWTGLAKMAERKRNWPVAAQCWREASARPNAPVWTLTGTAYALRQQKQLDAAETVLASAHDRFPNESSPLADLARLSEERRDWEVSLVRWRDFATRFPASWLGPNGQVAALTALGREAEAATILEAESARRPDAPEPWLERARLAQKRRDWPAAERFAREALARKQERPALLILVAALREQSQLDEAETVLTAATAQYPQQMSFAVDHARVAEARGETEAALERWLAAAARFPAEPAVALPLATALRTHNRASEARPHLAAARERAPGDPRLNAELARIAEEADDSAEAERSWRAGLPLDRNGACCDGLATLLRAQGRLNEAEDVLAEAIVRFPKQLQIAIGYAEVAEERQKWLDAVRRYGALARAFPGFSVAGRAQEARVRLLDEELHLAEARGGEIPSISEGDLAGIGAEERAEARVTMMAFESLGGIGGPGGEGGCEFGGVQRAYGAEPLGLLRWSGMSVGTLIDLLENRFEGVGEPEATEVIRMASGKLYGTRSKTYGFAMHGHVPVDSMAEEDFHNQVSRRLQFLRRKLLDDLAAGEKIFLMKDERRMPFADEIERLGTAFRSYGAGHFLYVGPADAEHSPLTVTAAAENVWLGYLDFAQKDRAARTAAWLQLCRAAYATITGRASPEAITPEDAARRAAPAASAAA